MLIWKKSNCVPQWNYIPLDNAEPKFLGETMTAAEFAEEETQDESMQPEGMGMSL